MHLQPVGDEPQSDPIAVAAELHAAVSRAVRGKPDAVRLALVALLSGGHLLVEDVPGTGKTLLARASPRPVAARSDGCSAHPTCSPPTSQGPASGRPQPA